MSQRIHKPDTTTLMDTESARSMMIDRNANFSAVIHPLWHSPSVQRRLAKVIHVSGTSLIGRLLLSRGYRAQKPSMALY